MDHIHEKARQRLGLLRKLSNLSINGRVLTIVYRSMIESILTYNIVSWYGRLTLKQKNKLIRVINEANKIIGQRQNTMQELFSQFMERKAIAVYSDQNHPSIPALRPSLRGAGCVHHWLKRTYIKGNLFHWR